MLTQSVRTRAPRRRARVSAVRLVAAVLLPGALVAAAPSNAGGRLTIAPESRLWVEGTSTVRAFTCYATKVDGTIGVQGEPTALEEVARAVDAVEIQVPVAALDCRNRTMNEHMRKALKATENPVVRYRMTSREVTPRDGGGPAVSLVGTLAIGGQEKEITMTADAVQDSTGQYRITGRAEFKMTEFGVKPPSLMLGAMKVHDRVVVRYEILLSRGAAVAAAQ